MLKRGETKRLAAAAGVQPSTIRNRLLRGWTLEQAAQPVMKPWQAREPKLNSQRRDAERLRWLLDNGELNGWTRHDIDKEIRIDKGQGI